MQSHMPCLQDLNRRECREKENKTNLQVQHFQVLLEVEVFLFFFLKDPKQT